VTRPREPILNLPPAVTAILATLVLAHAALALAPDDAATFIESRLAFIPARLALIVAPDATLRHIAELSAPDADLGALAAYLNDATGVWWTPLSYVLLHANAPHLFINSLTLAAFGAPLARRWSGLRFLGFFCATAVAGALAFFAVHPFDLAPVVGASGAISGVMAGVTRFAFAPGGVLAEGGLSRRRPEGASTPAQSLRDLLGNRRAMTFLILWFALNLLFGAFPAAAGAGSESIAWEAHVGGFLAGLLLFPLFDPARPRGEAA